jgi:hypothetical protein
MEDLIAQLKEASAGMSEEEIALALGECQTVPLDKVDVLASWLSTLNA